MHRRGGSGPRTYASQTGAPQTFRVFRLLRFCEWSARSFSCLFRSAPAGKLGAFIQANVPTTPGGQRLFGQCVRTPGTGSELGYHGHGALALIAGVTPTTAFWRCDTFEGRTPRLLLRMDGALLLRFAERALHAALLKLPPRLTRFRALWARYLSDVFCDPPLYRNQLRLSASVSPAPRCSVTDRTQSASCHSSRSPCSCSHTLCLRRRRVRFTFSGRRRVVPRAQNRSRQSGRSSPSPGGIEGGRHRVPSGDRGGKTPPSPRGKEGEGAYSVISTLEGRTPRFSLREDGGCCEAERRTHKTRGGAVAAAPADAKPGVGCGHFPLTAAFAYSVAL